MKKVERWALLAVVLSLVACQKPHEHGDHDNHAQEPVTPASRADGMCQHGVLQAICTKCNPRLIPVFQAKGDFCKEHGFPESVCPVCHPERGGKPALSVEPDQAPADGLKLRFARADTAKLAGLAWTSAVTKATTDALTAPVRLTYDGTKLAHVNARAAGVVAELAVDVGARVKRGDRLIVIDSPEVGMGRARLEAASARVAAAKENLEREATLVKEGIATRKTILALEQEVAEALAEESAIRASLSVLGRGGTQGRYTLAAPLAGVVTERRVTIGKLVASDEVLLEIVDTSSMWADVEVAELDLPLVSRGQAVRLRFDGLGDREIEGKISYVAPSVDPHTQSAKARVPLENPDGMLRANMFGEARIARVARDAGVFVPETAVQRTAGVPFVFVRLAPREFETRRVKLGPASGALVRVESGVKAGEEVVTTGSFLLKTETSKENIGAGCCEH